MMMMMMMILRLFDTCPSIIRKLSEALHKLSRLRILERKENTLVMNDTFRQEFKCALTGGYDHHQMNGWMVWYLILGICM